MKRKIFGHGCSRCRQLADTAATAAKELAIELVLCGCGSFIPAGARSLDHV